MSSIFGDYVAGFLGTTRQGNPYRLQPFDVGVILFKGVSRSNLRAL